MKVRASVKKLCENCKIIRRKGVIRVICTNARRIFGLRCMMSIAFGTKPPQAAAKRAKTSAKPGSGGSGWSRGAGFSEESMGLSFREPLNKSPLPRALRGRGLG